MNHELAISKHSDGTPWGWSFPDELRQALQSILDSKALGLIVGSSSTLVLSSPDDFHSIYDQDHESTCDIPFLGSAIELYTHCLAQDRACL